MKGIAVIFLSLLRSVFDALLLLFCSFPIFFFYHFVTFFHSLSRSSLPPYTSFSFPLPFCPFENTNAGNNTYVFKEKIVKNVLTNFICSSCMYRESIIRNILCRQESSNPEQEVPISWERHTGVCCPSFLSCCSRSHPMTEFKGSLGKYPRLAWWTEVVKLVWAGPVSSNNETALWISSSFLVRNGFYSPQVQLSS